MESYAIQRAEFGFRADLPYVRELIKRGVWEYDVGYIPVTPEENKYLKRRDELELGPRAERYLDRHKDVDGGVSVEDDWPREPYLLLHLKRDVAKHLAAIKRIARYPKNLRAEKAELQRARAQAARRPAVARQAQARGDRVRPRLDRHRQRAAARGDHHQAPGREAVLRRALRQRREDRGHRDRAVQLGCVDAGLLHGRRGRHEPRRELGERRLRSSTRTSRSPSSPTGSRSASWTSSSPARRPPTCAARRTPRRSSAPLGDRAVIDAFDREPLRQVGTRPGQPPCPPAPAEPSVLEEAIEARAEYGMRADPSYVRQRLSSRSLFTKAEARWLARVERLKQSTRRSTSTPRPTRAACSRRSIRRRRTSSTASRATRSKHLARAPTQEQGPRSACGWRTSTSRCASSEALDADDRRGPSEFDGFAIVGAYVDERDGDVVLRLSPRAPTTRRTSRRVSDRGCAPRSSATGWSATS